MSKYTPDEPTSIDDAREWLHQGRNGPNPLEVESKSSDKPRKERLLQDPTPLTYITYTESCTVMLDWFMEMAIQGDQNTYTKQGIADLTGVSRPYVSKHMHRFVETGIIEAVGEGNVRYKIPDDDDAIIYDLIDVNQRMMDFYYENAESEVAE